MEEIKLLFEKCIVLRIYRNLQSLSVRMHFIWYKKEYIGTFAADNESMCQCVMSHGCWSKKYTGIMG